ncbi:MAG TPA: hypothetical protein VFD13_02105 [Candidatus Kapabacteria bacterium]|nr:hypothetical protein [Candidatus Kapabacteria bacterium]
MKQHIFFLLLSIFLVPSSIFAQGSTSFWEPVPSPSEPIPFISMLPDSQFYTQVGGRDYLYVPGTNTWSPMGESDVAEIPFHGNLPNTAIIFTKGDSIYAKRMDTLFLSPDNGVSWKVLGLYGRAVEYANVFVLELPSSRVAIFNDTNTIYLSSDGFHTVDTIHPPEFMFYLYNDADTLLVTTIYGNLYRSTNYGVTWSEIANLHDSSRNRLSLLIKNNMWFLQGYRFFTFSYSDYWIGYSLDRGKSWTQMMLPVPTGEHASIVGIDSSNRLYLSTDSGGYRSDDTGRDWISIGITPQYITPDGTLYTGLIRSTDFGKIWQQLNNAGIQAVPFSMSLAHGDAWLSTLDSLYHTSDGMIWITSSDHNTGYLSTIRREGGWWCSDSATSSSDSDWLLVNTTHVVERGNDCCNSAQSGIGITTSHLNVWLSSVHNNLYINNPYISESLDTGCGFTSASYDTLSLTPITEMLETSNDTILAISTSGIYRGFNVYFPFDTVTPEPTATPTGALMKDSTGAIYAAMSDGKFFVTNDGANSWQSFPSPETDSTAPVISLAAAPNGLLFAVDSNHRTSLTTTWEYVPATQSWKNITSGLRRQGFPDTAEVTNIWYVNGYAYAGTWNMGLFRSVNPVGPVSSVASAKHDTPFHLYPNPASSFVTLTCPSLITGTYRIVDITGREMQRGTIPPNAGKVTLDVRGLPNGLYEVIPRELGTGADSWVPAKLVVQH